MESLTDPANTAQGIKKIVNNRNNNLIIFCTKKNNDPNTWSLSLYDQYSLLVLFCRGEVVFFFADGDFRHLFGAFFNRQRMIVAVGLVIIHATLDILDIHFDRSKKLSAKRLGLFYIEGPAAVNINRYKIFGGKSVDDD